MPNFKEIFTIFVVIILISAKIICVMRLNRKTIIYYFIKLAKQSGTPESISRGVTIGLAVGLVIPFGLQIPFALPLAFVLKANKIASVAFTFVTNHFTIFFIYPFQCYLGSHIVGAPLSYASLSATLKNFLHYLTSGEATFKQSYEELMLLGQDILIPFFVGGAALALIMGVTGYFLSLYLIRAFRNRKENRKEKRRLKRIEQVQNTNPTE